MTAASKSLKDVVIVYAANPNMAIQVDDSGKMVLFHREEQSDRQKFVLSNTDPGPVALWSISSVTASARVATEGENNQLVVISKDDSETEWHVDGTVAFGEVVRFRNRALERCFMTLKQGSAHDGAALVASLDVPGPSQQWRLDKPRY